MVAPLTGTKGTEPSTEMAAAAHPMLGGQPRPSLGVSRVTNGSRHQRIEAASPILAFPPETENQHPGGRPSNVVRPDPLAALLTDGCRQVNTSRPVAPSSKCPLSPSQVVLLGASRRRARCATPSGARLAWRRSRYSKCRPVAHPQVKGLLRTHRADSPPARHDEVPTRGRRTV